MNPENDSKHIRIKKATLLIGILVLAAGLLGWWFGRSDKPAVTTDSNNSQQNSPPTTDSSEVNNLVDYTLPDGWKESSCPDVAGSVFIIPAGADNLDCAANPSSPIKISMDTANNDNCNDLQNVQNVSKHICVSEFINGKKSLKAETQFNEQSSYKKATTVHAYYINTGKGIVKVEYIYNNSNDYQAGFDELAKSVAVKN